jgi:hypothetical protein
MYIKPCVRERIKANACIISRFTGGFEQGGFAVADELNAAKLNVQALSVEDLARLLAVAGRKVVTPEQIRADLEDGAPVGPDGRIHLLHYAAWLAREVQTW